MKTGWLCDLTDGANVETEVLIRQCRVRIRRDGSPYVELVAADRTARVTAKWWDASAQEREAVGAIRFARIWGRASMYNGTLEINVQRLEDLGVPTDLSDFLISSPIPLEMLEQRLCEHIDRVADGRLSALLKRMLVEDRHSADRFREYPAAMDRHHAYRHGLLEHTLEVADFIVAVSECQNRWSGQPFDRDLALTGALLHDIGKTAELAVELDQADYTDEGSFLGHVILGTEAVARAAAWIRRAGCDFPKLLERQVQHIIVSHHGKGEWGAPKAPASPEAAVVHYGDLVSTELFYFEEARRGASHVGRFVFQRKLDSGFRSPGRRVYVGQADTAPESPAPPESGLADEAGFPIPRYFQLPVWPIRDGETCADGADVVSLPVYGCAAAGQPLLHEANLEECVALAPDPLPGKSESLYLLRVRGESMIGDGIRDGDLVVVLAQNQAEAGDIVVASTQEGVNLKRMEKRGRHYRLLSSNPEFAPIEITAADTLQIYGKVIAIARPLSS